MRRVKKSGHTLTALPLPQAGTAPHQEVSPELLVPPVGKGGWDTGTSSLASIVGCFFGAPIPALPMGIAAESAGLHHWESVLEKEVVSNTWH